MLHARFVVLCGGDSVSVSFEQPAVEDRRTGEYQTVIADGDSLVITAGGAPLAVPDTGRIEATELRIEAKRFTLRAPHATVTRRDGALRIAPRP
jgi:hypothetical protein